MSWTLDRWFTARDLVRRLYLEELQRDVISDPDALTNTLYHAREDGRDEAWLRDMIRGSQEWKEKHGGEVGPIPPPAPPLPPIPPPRGEVQVLKISDGPFHPRLYSYWSNAIVIDGVTYVFAGRIHQTPEFFMIDRLGNVASLGTSGEMLVASETEGWYFNEDGKLYIPARRRLLCGDILKNNWETAWETTRDGHSLYQVHSSRDGSVHSATLLDSGWSKVGTIVYRNGGEQFFPRRGNLDESHITTNGEWLIIEEDNGNRIIELATGKEFNFSQEEGALSHIDCGSDFMVGEDDQHGECAKVTLPNLSKRGLFNTWGMGHVSVRAGRCLLSDKEKLALVDLDTGHITELYRHGVVITPEMSSEEKYNRQVRANLSPCGTRATFTVNRELYVMFL